MVFALINQSNMYGIGGKIFLHAANVPDLAKQLTFRVIRQILDDPIHFEGKCDALTSFVHLMDRIFCGSVKLDDLLNLDVEINGNLINCPMVAHGEKELNEMLRAVEAEIAELDPKAWRTDGIDDATGYSKMAARKLVSSYDDPILFAELLAEMNEVLYTEP